MPIPILILAAGASTRLGTAKQLVRFRGQSLLSHAIATALATDCGPVLVVLGAGADIFRSEAIGAGARVVENLEWETGMGSSLRAGVAAAEAEIPRTEAVLVLLCDQPLVTVELLSSMVRAYRDGNDLVAASYDGALGVPALFARRFFGELKELTGDVGARRVLTRRATEVCAIPFPDGTLDVDTPADLARLVAEGGS